MMFAVDDVGGWIFLTCVLQEEQNITNSVLQRAHYSLNFHINSFDWWIPRYISGFLPQDRHDTLKGS